MQPLEERTAQSILKNLRQNLAYPWREKMLTWATLPASVHDHARFRVRQRRFHDMNLRSPEKQDEKLNATIPSSGAW
jgi:hypothetical protein